MRTGLAYLLRCVFLAATLGLTPAKAAFATETLAPTLVTPRAQLPPGAATGEAEILIETDPRAQLTTVVALDGDNAPQIQIGKPEPAGSTLTKPELAAWRTTLHADHVPPGYTRTRYLILHFKDGSARMLALDLSNQTPDSQPLAIRPLGTIAITIGHRFPLNVSTGAFAATSLHIEQATLSEKTGHSLLGGGVLALCTTSDGACTPPGPMKPHTSTRLWVDGAKSAGQFDGYVSVAADEKPEGVTSAPGSILVSSVGSKLLGFALLVVGMGASWFITNVLKTRWVRLQWEAKAAEALATAGSLEAKVARGVGKIAGVSTPQLAARFDDIHNGLSPEGLKQAGLPSPWGQAFANPFASDEQTRLTATLQQIAQCLAALDVVVCEGLTPLKAAYDAAQNDAGRTDAVTKIGRIDDLATQAGLSRPLDQIRSDIAGIVAPDRHALLALVSRTASAPSLPTQRQIQARLGMINVFGWAFVLGSTALVGVYTVILSSGGAAFGTPLDLFTAFIWGLGFPAGAMLAQTTLSTVAGALRST